MDRDPWPSTYDRELDVPSRRATGPTEPFDGYRRLVANPLLAVAFGVGAVLLVRASLRWSNPAIFLVAVAVLVASPLLIQFHCLDCGRTAGIFGSGRHACAPALARWRENRRSRWAFPSSRAQVVLWLHVLASVGVLLLVLAVSRR